MKGRKHTPGQIVRKLWAEYRLLGEVEELAEAPAYLPLAFTGAWSRPPNWVPWSP